MDVRAKTVVASFLALMGFLALAAWASMNHAQPNRALQGALFDRSE
ncbi:hypothetical protein [Paragemmobacter ruber]|uniref:Uncharacterized protein n=1 Tax=Paragemmobacter ruber TaxID=1985673 RepID=A0ABW9Y1Z9_9RHOB|nr:hypothetical protein [Rhodobacter ruber]NBE06535.1 hypothetical protein [Rhodobacter ruber]